MEQWEKEYLDTVTRVKRNGGSTDSSYEEGYDSSRWDEVTRADGSKYYVPKVQAFEKTARKKAKVKNAGAMTLQRMKGIAYFVIAVLAVVLINSSDKIDEIKIRPQVSTIGFIQGQLLGGTYRNGYGFADMMHFFEEMQTERYSFLEDVSLNINSLNNVDSEKWNAIFDEREQKLDCLKYDKSYVQYVDAEKQVFEKQKEILKAIKSGVDVESIVQQFNDLVTSEFVLRDEKLAAMKKNGIEYTEDGKGLTYWYKRY